MEKYSCTPQMRELGMFKVNGSLVGLAKDWDLSKPVGPTEGVVYSTTPDIRTWKSGLRVLE
jgi:hypothetical protein